MKYYVHQKFSFGDKKLIELKAKNIENAVKEVFVLNFCDRWSYDIPDIDYDNFNDSLMSWIKTLPRFWNLKEICELIDDNMKFYGSLKECVYGKIKLLPYGCYSEIQILAVEEVYDKFDDVEKLSHETIKDAIVVEMTKMKEEKERLEYERLKNKFEEKP